MVKTIKDIFLWNRKADDLEIWYTRIRQVPVLVMFVLKCSLLKNFNLLLQATNILKTIKILLLMVQFHNTPTHFAKLASGETGIGYQGPQPVSE